MEGIALDTRTAPGTLASPSIVARGLTKRFGSVTAVSDLSFEVRPGRVTGFLGPNGAGKSTTLRMVLDLVRPTSGTATVLGLPYRSLDHPTAIVGAVLETHSFHPRRTGRNHLRVVAAASGTGDVRVDEVLTEVGLADAARRKVGGYSLGMRQRLGLAGALLNHPRVLILDEPANGLDPQGIRWLRELLRSFASHGNAVLISSHLLAEMSQLADDVIVINHGRLLRQAAVHDLTAGAGGHRVRTARDDELAGTLRAAGMSVTRDDHGLLVSGGSLERIGELSYQAGIPVFELHGGEASLEDVFLQMTETNEEVAS